MAKSAELMGGVMVILVRDHKILLMKRAKHLFNGSMWAFPGGRLDAGESVAYGAAREAFEEIGVEIDPSEFKAPEKELTIYAFDQDNLEFKPRLFYFGISQDFKNEPINKEPEKADELRWFPLDELPENMIPWQLLALYNWQNKIPFSEYQFSEEEILMFKNHK